LVESDDKMAVTDCTCLKNCRVTRSRVNRIVFFILNIKNGITFLSGYFSMANLMTVSYFLKLEVPAAVKIHVVFFQVVTPCSVHGAVLS
jgi:hypothetical protein